MYQLDAQLIAVTMENLLHNFSLLAQFIRPIERNKKEIINITSQ